LHLYCRRTSASSRRISPELCVDASPPMNKGAGKTGSRLAPIDRHAGRKLRALRCIAGNRATGDIPAFPAQWFYGLCRALPGERCTIAPVALRMTDAANPVGLPHHRETWRTDPGRQDDTILPYANRTRRWRDAIAHGCPPCEALRAGVVHVHRPPARVRDDRDTPLFLGPGCGDTYAVSEFR